MTVFIHWERLCINDELNFRYVISEPPYDALFTGVAVSWYRNGVLEIERDFIDGADVGYQHWWYPSGQIKEHVEAVSDSKWVVRYWHENGQLERYFIRRGWKELELKRWDELGIVVEHRVWPGHVAEVPDDTSTLSAVPVARSLGIPRHLIEQPHGYTVTD